MELDRASAAAMDVGRRQADATLVLRERALRIRAEALAAHPSLTELRVQVRAGEQLPTAPVLFRTAGVLVAEGDSWFDYPLHDVLKILEDHHGYDVESVAHKGDPIEEMAYGGNQLEDLARRLEKVLARGIVPRALLLSGGGNDVAGPEFGMLLNHAGSSIAGLNTDIVNGLINQRVRIAYITILSAVTSISEQKLGKKIPILLHGYDYPVPDGRGFLGGWWLLPGPWLEPGFREKGYVDLTKRMELAHDLMDQFNEMLRQVSSIDALTHVRYIDLRNTLSTAADDYKEWWANELHPTEKGFELIAKRFVDELNKLP